MEIGEAKLKVILALGSVGTTTVLQRAMVDFDSSYAIFSVIGNIIIYLLIILSDKEEKPKRKGELRYWAARLALGAILSVLLTKFLSDKTGINDILVSILIGIFCENFRELIEISKKVGISAWEGFLERILKGKKMENNTRSHKLLILMGFLVLFSIITAMSAIYHKRVMKGKVKELYSIVISKQVRDSLPIDSIKNNIEKFRDIDSTGFTEDVKVIDIIIKDYKRISGGNKVSDSLLKKKSNEANTKTNF